MARLTDYLELGLPAARRQLRDLRQRRPVPSGNRQVDFVPAETLLCLAASFLVQHSRFGGSTSHLAPEPVQSLARLFKRPPSSVLAKMANLDGSRSNGAKHDISAGATLREDPAAMAAVYRTLFVAARAEGIGVEELPDFLLLEDGGDLVLLGQDELTQQGLAASARHVLLRESAPEEGFHETERILIAAMRVGQHRFAKAVLHNCGNACVFCGFAPPGVKNQRLLVASHIKPWSDCDTSRERLDHRNGLAACPTHDVAFDQGLLTVNGGLRIHVASVMERAVAAGGGAQHFFARPPLRETLLLPAGADAPESRYLQWHKENIFAA